MRGVHLIPQSSYLIHGTTQILVGKLGRKKEKEKKICGKVKGSWNPQRTC